MGIDAVHMIIRHPTQYANTESIWVNKEVLILPCVSVHVNDCFFKGEDAFLGRNISPVANGNKNLGKEVLKMKKRFRRRGIRFTKLKPGFKM